VRNRVQHAAVVSAVVLAYLAVQQVVFTVAYLNGLPLDQVGMMLSGIGGLLFSQYLPFSVGVFASLWLVAPVVADASLASVIRRSVLAAGIGAVLVVFVRAAVSSVGAFSGVGSFVSNSFPSLPLDNIVWAFGNGIQAGLGSFVQVLPLVMLVVVLSWMWLARHPLRHAVSVDSANV
jgi:hypothetical protein